MNRMMLMFAAEKYGYKMLVWGAFNRFVWHERAVRQAEKSIATCFHRQGLWEKEDYIK